MSDVYKVNMQKIVHYDFVDFVGIFGSRDFFEE